MHYAKLEKEIISKLFAELDNNDSLEAICHIEKELRKVKRPLDLFNKQII
jgi:hypothetical protein